jgi:hypothetical protein
MRTCMRLIVVVFFGALTIALSFAASYFTSKLVQATSTVWGVIGGPLAGIFIMGLFMPFCNSTVSHCIPHISWFWIRWCSQNSPLEVLLHARRSYSDRSRLPDACQVPGERTQVNLYHSNASTRLKYVIRLQGAICGMVGSLVLTMWISIGGILYAPPTPTLPVGICRGNLSISLPPPNPNVSVSVGAFIA